MTKHKVTTREEWLAARLDLLKAEKDFTRRGDDLAQARQALPWVRVEKNYAFDTQDGKRSLRDLFGGRSQLIVYHFMFGPTFKAGCPSCSSIADGFNGIAVHLQNHDVALWAVSRAPFAKLQEYQTRMGWTFPWASSAANDFNYDYNVSFSEEAQRDGDITYNFRHAVPAAVSAPPPAAVVGFAASVGTDVPTYTRDRPGISTFVLEDDVVYHAYSTYARGVDATWGMYQWLDRAPKGRNESTGPWWRRHDEY